MYGAKRRYSRKKKGRFARYASYGKRFAGGVATVAKLARDVAYLRSVVNVERKYIDVINSIASSTTPTLVNLNGCQVGSTAVTRLGQSIKMVSVYGNFSWTINGAATTTYVRAIVFLDRQANGAAPAAADVLTTPANVLSTMLIGNSRRFKVLMDIRCTLSINGNEITKYRRYRKMNVHTEYNTGNAGSVADIQTNSLFLLHMSDQGVNTPTFAYDIRTRFIDN